MLKSSSRSLNSRRSNLKKCAIGERSLRNEIFEMRAENLLKNHPQSSPEDLLKMSFKYRALLDSMQGNVRLLDSRMLGIFNEEQYNLYIMLCNQIGRSPIYAQRSVNKK